MLALRIAQTDKIATARQHPSADNLRISAVEQKNELFYALIIQVIAKIRYRVLHSVRSGATVPH